MTAERRRVTPAAGSTARDGASRRSEPPRRLVEVAVDAVGCRREAGPTRTTCRTGWPTSTPGEAVLVEFGRRQALGVVARAGGRVAGDVATQADPRARPLRTGRSCRRSSSPWPGAIAEHYLAPPAARAPRDAAARHARAARAGRARRWTRRGRRHATRRSDGRRWSSDRSLARRSGRRVAVPAPGRARGEPRRRCCGACTPRRPPDASRSSGSCGRRRCAGATSAASASPTRPGGRPRSLAAGERPPGAARPAPAGPPGELATRAGGGHRHAAAARCRTPWCGGLPGLVRRGLVELQTVAVERLAPARGATGTVRATPGRRRRCAPDRRPPPQAIVAAVRGAGARRHSSSRA